MSIAALRREIDRIDRKLVALLSARARRSLAIGRLKRDAGLPLFYHRRELEISGNARRANRFARANEVYEQLSNLE